MYLKDVIWIYRLKKIYDQLRTQINNKDKQTQSINTTIIKQNMKNIQTTYKQTSVHRNKQIYTQRDKKIYIKR